MRNAETILDSIRQRENLPAYVKVTGEPLDIERVMSGSERGRWKSVGKDNSLAAYPTACAVLRGRGGGDTALLPGGANALHCKLRN